MSGVEAAKDPAAASPALGFVDYAVNGAASNGESNNAGIVTKGGRGVCKKSHKKSRNGCHRCKARRVKCDEVHPVCRNCKLHQTECVYDLPKAKKADEKPESRSSLQIRLTPPYKLEIDEPRGPIVDDLPESRARRFRELRLFHHYTIRTCLTVGYKFTEAAIPTQHPGRELWRTVIPELALQHDALLYAIYSISALHIVKTKGNDPEASEYYLKYLDLALREHRKDVENIGKQNADRICMTSSVIRLIAFALLQERPLEPYAPPSEWLEMTASTGSVFRTAWQWLSDDDTSVTMALLKRAPPELWNKELMFKEENRRDLLHLLRRTQKHIESEPWDVSIQEAYEMALSYLGSVLLCIPDGESTENICRRLITFPLFLPRRFIDLVEEMQPRALVVMSYFFALLAKMRDIWWVGDIGKREVTAMQAVLPDEWQDLMEWPMRTMEEKFVLG
ncbi:hypothetical protein F5884DRAFT_675305 [Xylogone sp. PMI_703]|nr:hypothetical protein F5884DRAFT_675305 [Xylogone sp. PMI_703]